LIIIDEKKNSWTIFFGVLAFRPDLLSEKEANTKHANTQCRRLGGEVPQP
jgi:hypothetical protein